MITSGKPIFVGNLMPPRMVFFLFKLFRQFSAYCGLTFVLVGLSSLGACSDEAVGAGTLACIPGEPLRCDQTLTKVLRCNGQANAWVVDRVCSATERCEEATCVADPGNPFIGGGGSLTSDTFQDAANGADIDEFMPTDTN